MSSRRHGVMIAALLAVGALITRAAFMYRDGMGDPDPVAMAAGMAWALWPDVNLADTLLYGRQLSPGVFVLFDALYRGSPATVLSFLNWTNVVFAALLVIPLFAVFRRSLGVTSAAGAISVFLFSPIVWELGTYFFPLIPASFLLFTAFALRARVGRSAGGGLALAAMIVLSALAVLLRIETLFAAPAVLVWAAMSRRRGRDLALTSAILMLSIATYLVVQRSLEQSTTVAHHDFRSYATRIAEMYAGSFSPAGIARSSVWLTLGVGVATVACCVWGLARGFRGVAGELRRQVIVCAALVLPTVAFWLPQPVPILRHYFFVAMGLSWLVGAIFWTRSRARVVAGGCILVILINLALPELTYGIYNARHPRSPKSPHGAFFSWHQRNRRQIDRYRQLCQQIELLFEDSRSKGGPGALVVVNWESYAYVLLWMVSSARPGAVSRTPVAPGIRQLHYRYRNKDVLLLHTRAADEGRLRRFILPVVEAALADGYAVFAPREVTEPPPIVNGAPVITY